MICQIKNQSKIANPGNTKRSKISILFSVVLFYLSHQDWIYFLDVFLQGETWIWGKLNISHFEKLRWSLMYLFCCAKFSMADSLYNYLADLMDWMNHTVYWYIYSQGGSCNINNFPTSLSLYKNISISWFHLINLNLCLLTFF